MKPLSRASNRFVVCVENEDYPASLERWKIYQAIPDREAEKHHQVRVIDESGEDYLYPSEYFRPVKLPTRLRKLHAATVGEALSAWRAAGAPESSFAQHLDRVAAERKAPRGRKRASSG